MEEIRVIRLPDAIRKRPQMYFGVEQPTNENLIKEVIADALPVSTAVSALRSDPFALVHADIDWMSPSSLADRSAIKGVEHVADLFDRLLPRGAPPLFECRAEALVAAACTGWITFGGGEVLSRDLDESDLPRALGLHLRTHARAFAWRFDVAHWNGLRTELTYDAKR